MLLRSVWLALLGAGFGIAIPVEEDAAQPKLVARQAATTPPPSTEKTVTVTVTSEQRNFSPTTVSTTVLTTIFSTIIVTATDFVTSTVTKSNVDTATVTNYVTSTIMAKRWLVMPPRETGPAEEEEQVRQAKPTFAAATITQDPAPTITGAEWSELDLIRRELERFGLLQKRVVTVTTTQLAIFDGITTIFRTITNTVIGTTTSQLRTTSTILTTTFANAKTTVTVVSTLTVTSTTVAVSGPTTVAAAPTTGNYGTVTNSPSTTGGGGGGGTTNTSEAGLSTGAKAGIGAGVGGVALAVIVAGIIFCVKRRNSGPKPEGIDDMGMSEVPVGSPLVGAAAALSARTQSPRSPPPRPGTTEMDTFTESAWKPPVSPGAAELGSDTSGTPKPTHGASELGSESGTHVPGARPGFVEADSQPVMSHNSGPVGNVYEMPAQHYR
jgi:hypothetical protein